MEALIYYVLWSFNIYYVAIDYCFIGEFSSHDYLLISLKFSFGTDPIILKKRELLCFLASIKIHRVKITAWLNGNSCAI